ncbi:metallophosphoesterase [Chromatium okenii]|uniref:metallophosphoesterase n=1 Tax=Chromatium okenii TaxID=61644 RepID=UPI001F5B0B0C|nr:metallophosphoesterase [Chromatium okenii]
MSTDLPPLRVAQLSDLHLFAAPSSQLLGITTRTSFEAVLALALESAPAALLVTGDLVQDHSATAYQALRKRLDASAVPYDVLAGNHDHPDLCAAHFGAGSVAAVRWQRRADWNLGLLNSQVSGRNRGGIVPAQLAAIEQRLRADAAPTVLALHHHPLPSGSAWLDQLDAEGGAELLALCDAYPQVRAVLFGHIHQEFTQARGHYQLLAAPATCVQFQPHSAQFAVGRQQPGYREVLLHADGHLTSRVVRLSRYHEVPLAQSTGY